MLLSDQDPRKPQKQVMKHQVAIFVSARLGWINRKRSKRAVSTWPRAFICCRRHFTSVPVRRGCSYAICIKVDQSTSMRTGFCKKKYNNSLTVDFYSMPCKWVGHCADPLTHLVYFRCVPTVYFFKTSNNQILK